MWPAGFLSPNQFKPDSTEILIERKNPCSDGAATEKGC